MINSYPNTLKNLARPLMGIFALAIFSLLNVLPVLAVESPRATVAVLSHTDFLPDVTGVYDRRSWYGRDKDPAFAANNDLRTGSDQAYDNVTRTDGYDPEAVGLPEVLADAILEQLTKSMRFIPVERKSLRTAVLEQRFGKQISQSYLDRTLDKAIEDMDKLETAGVVLNNTAVDAANYNDIIHDFKDLGTAVGADFLVLGNLQQLGSGVEIRSVPLSERGRKVAEKTAEARLRLRVIDARSSTVVGADSLHLKVSTMLFSGGKESRDDFEFMDQVSKQAANKILDIVFPAKIVSLEPMIISRGSNDGVVVGDYFNILREGKELKESSGAVIARLKTEVASVRVTQVQDNISVVDVDKGGSVETGDLAFRVAQPISSDESAGSVPLSAVQGSSPINLPRVAVGLVKAGSTAKTGPDAGKHVPTFTDTIISRLVQSKRFTVIDRQEVDQLLDEQMARAMAENRNMASAMGSLKGCDYLIIGSLQNFSMEEKSIKLPNSSRVMEVLDGFAEGNMRIVDARSGDILESRKIKVETQLDQDISEDRLIATLADSFAARVVANLLNAVYPIKVATVTADGIVYVNRGTDGLLGNGAVLDVMRPGEKVKDPDTGIELGVVEKRVGQVELVSIEDNRSTGRILEGDEIQAGDILKLVRQGEAKAETAGTRFGGTLPGSQPVSKQSASHVKINGKATLALVKITFNPQSNLSNNSGSSVVHEGTMARLTDLLGDSLVKTNRFTMMERREIDQVIDEKVFQSVSQGGDIRAYLKELKGADYIVAGELTNAYIKTVEKNIPYLDEKQVEYFGVMEGNVRIVDSHSSAMAAGDTIRINRKFKKIEIDKVRTELLDQYVLEAADNIVQRIYPTKVLGIMADGTIFINRGADAGLQVGSTFTVERPGQDLIDKDTGISFGAGEITVGKIEITSVEAARARARMMEGEMPLAGDILRNNKAPEKPAPKKKMKVAW
jgi:curli biogenesis system outer membrane secretion channel CsgG